MTPDRRRYHEGLPGAEISCKPPRTRSRGGARRNGVLRALTISVHRQEATGKVNPERVVSAILDWEQLPNALSEGHLKPGFVRDLPAHRPANSMTAGLRPIRPSPHS